MMVKHEKMMVNHDRCQIGEADFADVPRAYVVYGHRDDDRPLYVGKAATQSLRSRWQRQHLRGRSGGSALRRSLGVHLGLVGTKLRKPDRYYPDDVERAITVFLESCWIDFYPAEDADAAGATEHRLIAALDPELNVMR